VHEETGIDLTSRLQQADYLEMTIKEQRITLYIVPGVRRSSCASEVPVSDGHAMHRKSNGSSCPICQHGRDRNKSRILHLTEFVCSLLKEFIRVNKPSRRRQPKHKSDNNSADLSLQIDQVEEDHSHIVATSYTAIRLDHNTRGSSSSSVDNGDPQTPSPQSVEAYAVTANDDHLVFHCLQASLN